MKIQMNKDIDAFREDFYKGLTGKEVILGGCIVAIGAFIYGGTYYLLGTSTFSLMATMIVTFPLAMLAFMKKYGMSLPEYYFRVLDVQKHPLYLYESEESLPIQSSKEKKSKTQKKKRERKVHFDQMDEEGGEEKCFEIPQTNISA